MGASAMTGPFYGGLSNKPDYAGSCEPGGESAKTLQKRAVKGAREKCAETQGLRFPCEVREHDLDIPAELPQDLPARPAGRSQRAGVGDNSDTFESAGAFRNRFEDRDPFRAERQSISCVFDVAAGVDTAVRILDRGPYFEVRERRMSILTGGDGGGNKRVHY